MKSTLLRSLVVLAVSTISFGAQAASYNTNLIVNGDAESGVAGWTPLDDLTPLFMAVEYGNNWVMPGEPGPADRGAMMFAGTSGFGYSAGYQILDLSANAAAIATGNQGFELTGWLGGWTSQGDNSMLLVSFLDANGTELDVAQLGPVLPADRNDTTGLYYRASSGFLPTATTQVKVLLDMERLVSNDNDGYADNLSFVLTPVPEPETYALMLAGLGLVGFAARRSRAAR
jgi:hypothetical protein